MIKANKELLTQSNIIKDLKMKLKKEEEKSVSLVEEKKHSLFSSNMRSIKEESKISSELLQKIQKLEQINKKYLLKIRGLEKENQRTGDAYRN